MTSVVAVLGKGVVDRDQPVLMADDLGFTRGDGCFDATRVVLSPEGSMQVDHLDAHLDRFEASAAGLDMHVDRAAWMALVEEALAAWDNPGEATLKLLLTRGRDSADEPTGVVTIDLFPDLDQRRGLKVVTLDRGYSSTTFQDARWLLGGVKTTSYAVNMAAKREAARRGARDALFVTSDGYLLEGPNAALVWARNDELHSTQHEGTGVLRSITQAVAFEQAEAEGVGTHYGLARLAELMASDGAWLLSSIRGVAPILAVDDAELTPDPEWTARLNRWTGFPVSQ